MASSSRKAVIISGVRGQRLTMAASLLALLVVLPGCGGTHRRAATGEPQQVSASTSPPAPIALTGGWGYLPDPGNVGLRERWGQGGAPASGWKPVAIPNDFNPVVQAAGDRGTVGWYQVHFTGPRQPAGRSWSVRFEDVRRDAAVWLNGRLIGVNTDPYTPFALPASSLAPGRQNTLIVRVDNIKGPGSLPEDWWNWGGILGPVTLEPVGRVELGELGVMPELGCDYRCGSLLIQGSAANLTRAALRPEIELHVTSPAGATFTSRRSLPRLAPGGSVPVSFAVPLHGPVALWSPSDPALYSVDVLTIAGGRIEQLDSVHVGMRSVQVHGGFLFLNGRRLWLHGASIHDDADGRGAALTNGDIDKIVSELRSVGANVTRAHYMLSPRLLDALDQAGILVWSQAPVDHADPQLTTLAGRQRALRLLRDTILAERSHPSVIVDSVANELSPTPDTTPGTRAYLNQAIALARRLDPAAPVGLDTFGWPGFPAQATYRKLGVLGVSSYFGWYRGPAGHSIANFNELAPFLAQMHSSYPGQAVVVDEFGAEGLFDGPATQKGTYEFQSSYVRRTVGVLDQLPFINGMLYWTLREFAEGPYWIGGADLPPGDAPDGLHHKGLIAYNGTEKPAFAVAKELFADPPPFVAQTPPP